MPATNFPNGIVAPILSSTGTANTAITDATTAHTLNASFSDTEVEAALDALGTKLNEVIAALEAAQIVES